MKLVMKLSVLLILVCTYARATILITGSKNIRSYQNFTIVISNIPGETIDDCLLNVRLEGVVHDHRPAMLYSMQTVRLMADTNKIVNFYIPRVNHGNFRIIIEGKQPSTISTDNIYRKVKLNYTDYYQKPSSLIQLNKPVITPGEILKFRVIVVEADLKPASSYKTPISVYIFDPMYKMIRKWSHVGLYNGIFEDEIAIPSIPVLGTYQVEVTVKGNSVWKTFEVRNYDIDSIDLNIYPAVVPLLQHQALNLTIDVKNCFGKPIRGIFTISSVETGNGTKLVKKPHSWDVNGIRQIYLPFEEESDFFGQIDVSMKVNFTDQYTNRTISKKKQINLYHSLYKVKIHNKVLTQHPGSPFVTKLKVTYWNDEPAKNVTLLVVAYGANITNPQNCTSNMYGVITFSMHTNESTELKLLQVYDGNKWILNESIEIVDSANLLEDKYIKVELVTRY
ncbi:CD109 antigen-like [Anopheles darlingi]|uniref:CD109 antigen-like n=1 Tax=Anopheles darlingi TaxID=43151 RepID=UPI0021003F4E|nr:CD109 antigen-like [Anopheles darlingi]